MEGNLHVYALSKLLNLSIPYFLLLQALKLR